MYICRINTTVIFLSFYSIYVFILYCWIKTFKEVIEYFQKDNIIKWTVIIEYLYKIIKKDILLFIYYFLKISYFIRFKENGELNHLKNNHCKMRISAQSAFKFKIVLVLVKKSGNGIMINLFHR